MLSSRPVSPIDSIVVQDLPAHLTQQQLPVSPVSIVHRPNITDALTSSSCAADANAECSYHGAEVSTLRPPFLSSEMHEPTAQYFQPSAASDLGNLRQQSDALSRQPEHTFSRSAAAVTSVLSYQPATRTSTRVRPPSAGDDVMTSALSRPLTAPSEVLTSALPRLPSLVGPPSREDVVTSALPRSLPVPGDLPYVDNTRQRDFVADRNVYTHTSEQWLPEFSLPPPVHNFLCHRQYIDKCRCCLHVYRLRQAIT